jgi:16S rRNA (guanine527-N7)-methyltransferase
MMEKFSILKKHINVSHETLEKLIIYFELLNFWQKKMNLVSNSSLQNAETRHFLDSAQLYVFCKNLNGNIIDFGSGAGFPGAVLSILGISKIFLVESSKKKCNFLATLKRETNSNFKIVNSRIENLEFLDPSLIVSRALTSTKNLLLFSINHMLKSKNIKSEKEALKNIPNLLFLKGKTFNNELNDLPENLNIKFQIFPSITSAESRILLYNKSIL